MTKTTAILEVLAMVKSAFPAYCANYYLNKYAANDLADFIETLAGRLEEMTRK